MLEFPHKNFPTNKTHGSIIMKDTDIEDYAERVLEDYTKQPTTIAEYPTLLKTPQPFPYSHFLEFYIESQVRYVGIVPLNEDEQILGACCFDDNVPLKVYNEERKCVEEITLNTRDIVLHTLLEKDEQETIRRFTALHECGHWVLHRPYFQKNNNQLSFFEEEKRIQCCRAIDIEQQYYKGKQLTHKELIEHQANVFSASIAMQRKIIEMILPDIFKKHGYTPQEQESEEIDLFAKLDIINEIKTLFGVSKKMTEIRLEQLGVWYKDKKPTTLLDLETQQP